MKHTRPLLLIILLCLYQACTQKSDPKYLNETPPGEMPKVFAPGKISKESEFEFGAVFSNDRSEFYYAVEIDGKAETRMMRFDNDNQVWSEPVKILIHDEYSFNDPFLTPDEQKLFFISNRPLIGNGPKKDYDIWYVQRKGNKWSEPINAGENINTEMNEYYISFTKNDKMYFASNKFDGNHDIYSSQLTEAEFQPAVRLPKEINTSSYEADVFVAPDESYVVFSASHEDGLGSGDLHVSFRNADGTWTPSKSLGNVVNTETNDFCPYVTPDGKYLFYASRGDVYWVSAEVIMKLK